MKKLLALFLLLVSVASASDQQLFVQIEEIVADLGKITGLKPLKPVPHALIGKEEVKKFLAQRMKEELQPEELRVEELALKKFGFVPQDFDLRQVTVDLLTEQAAAFYDFRAKKLYVLDSSSSEMQQAALVHELAHALADQHFHLEKYIARANENDDGAMARLAVMEGQATWLMSEYLARRMGVSLKTSPSIVQLMSSQAGDAAGQFPVFDKAPFYIRQSLLFPYTKGMLFQHALYEKDDQAAFSEVFRRPPVSTQQILHPEKYFSGEKPSEPALAQVSSRGEFRLLTEGSIGEFDHSVLLEQYTGREEAEAVAPLWRGGRFELLEHKKDGHTVLAYSSEWTDAAAAKKFFDLYRRVLKGKWTNMEVTTAQPGVVSGRGDDGYFVLRLDGATVSSLEGLKTPAEAKETLR
jgi:hypothetical protein